MFCFDLYSVSMHDITLQVSRHPESRVLDLRRQLEEISVDHQTVQAYTPFAALYESGVTVESFLTMQVSQCASCVLYCFCWCGS